MMIFIRSLLFSLILYIWVPIYAMMVLCTFPFEPHTRYKFIRGLAFSVMWLLRVVCNMKKEMRGVENIPKEPCIVMCKHQSAWETFAMQTIFPSCVYVLKRELLWLPFMGWGLYIMSSIAIKRSKGKQAMRQLLEQGTDRLERGFCVMIFPEGTRIPYGQRGKYKMGGALLAEATGAPVVPVAHNAGKFWGRNAFLKYPGTVVMSVGKPIDPRGKSADEINRLVEEWIEAEIPRLG
jgi:1-acyl-sn-glycerol-3-phosphate acyltransferase